LKENPQKAPAYTVFDISALLRGYGWQVPAYTMPDAAGDVAVLRVVVREGFSANLARALRDDLVEVLDKLAKLDSGGFASEQHFAH
jgi:glutamate decarboxylase